YQQLAVLARAGVPLRTSLHRLQEIISGREMAVLTQKIDAGEQVGEAFAAARFSPFEYHLVAAGERSGRLEAVFQHLSEFWARQQEMIQALIGQLYYPLAVLHLTILVGSLLELTVNSWPIVILHLIENFAWVYALGFALYMVVITSWQSDAAQRFWLGLPIIGWTLSTAYAYRWITVLKLEYSAGIPMPDAVADAWRASGYAGRDQLADEGQEVLREGGELSTLVQRWKRLPREWVDFIETGEVSGALETALENLEAEAARAWKTAQQRMTEWVPKIFYFIILLIAAVQVGLMLYHVVVAPITDINGTIDKALNGD
ncbi:MAG TPA: type II secretion system F family protein, partial [Candidatus Methylacidiphilales bacterium]